MAAPAVSVVMPVYNGERWLSHALESALAQTFTDFELVVVDDGSTDGSVSIVQSFAERDPRVRLVRTAHAGLAPARTVSLAEAGGQLVAFLDADDEWVPERLERQLPLVDDRTVVFSDFWYLDDGDTEMGPRLSEAASLPAVRYPAVGLFPYLLTYGCFIQISSVLAPRELLVEAGAFRGFPGCEDYEMWLRLAVRGARFDYVDEPLMVYRKHSGSLSADLLWVLERNLLMADNLMPDVVGDDLRLLRRARRRWMGMIATEHRRRGWQHIASGDPGAARLELARSLRVRPYSPRAWLVLALMLCPPVARVVRAHV
jgi:glycosyltransferase involved in cell wall biosynthesis